MNLIWHTDTKKISSLKQHPKNPRKITKKQLENLKESIKNFNYVETVAINLDGTILAGHMRVKALQSLGRGDEEIEVRVPNRLLTDKECEEYLVRSNKNSGEWDWDRLFNEWKTPDLLKWGFSENQIKKTEKIDFIDEEINEKEAKQPKTKLGDRYQLANHVLVCGDSTQQLYVDMCLDGAAPILMVADPPYGVNYKPYQRDKYYNAATPKTSLQYMESDTKSDWKDAISFFKGDIGYVWHANAHQAQIEKSLNELNFEVKSQIIWVKQSFLFSYKKYHYQHEPCFYLVRKGKKQRWKGPNNETTVWQIKSLNVFGGNIKEEKTGHACQKPIECMARPIRNHTDEGESVYDPFLGSGTTLIAAEQINRICYGIEIDPAFCDLCVQRWVNHRKKVGKEPLVLKNGEKCEEFSGS